MNRFHRLYQWQSDRIMTRLGTPRDDQSIRAAQVGGKSGWIVLQRPAQAFFVARSQLSFEPITISIDERCFDDTVIRVERDKKVLYLADIFIWQGVLVHKTMSFSQRQEILHGFFKYCYTPCPSFESVRLSLRPTTGKGYEHYSTSPGDIGTFSIEQYHTIRKTDTPDVYAVEDGYLNVPTLELSKKLREMGDVFEAKCKKVDDLWEIIAFKE